jgi:hypothetical protein
MTNEICRGMMMMMVVVMMNLARPISYFVLPLFLNRIKIAQPPDVSIFYKKPY